MVDSDIHATGDYGYDPTIAEDIPLKPVPAAPTAYPPTTTVNQQYLPPVGQQTTPSCFVWSSTYCATTFAAALSNGTDPTSADGQASPIYTYIKVEEQQGVANNTCNGGKIAWCFEYLYGNGGTASMAQAENLTGCSAAWSAWGTPTVSPNWQFQVMQYQGTPLKGPDGLNNMRNLIWMNTTIVYGTSLYTDFSTYDGSPVPYVGNGIIAINKKTGKPVGHCMVIIGYDDNCGPHGAVLIQNSFGQNWGSVWAPANTGGYVWMDYNTFQALAQGGGYYITLMQDKAPQ